MANAKKLPSGRWNVLVYAGKDAQGKRRYESFTADTKKEAERDAAVYIMERKRRKRESITLGEAIDRFVETCRVQ